VRDQSTPLISLAAAEDVTQRKANPFVIRPSAPSGQCRHAMGDYAVKRMATISDDFAFGHEQMSAFQRVYEDAGDKVVKKLWPPPVRQCRWRIQRLCRLQPREVHARLCGSRS
jgi:branched-chain amino acid transport system substrate-binding protein